MSRGWNVFKSLISMLTLKQEYCYSCIQSYDDCFGNNPKVSYSPKITQPLEKYQQAVMTHIVLFALQINSISLSQWYLSKSRKYLKLSS